jgi:Family of unknown function (DUF6812)
MSSDRGSAPASAPLQTPASAGEEREPARAQQQPGGEEREPSGEQRESSADHRRERVSIETERHRITGFLTLARDGYRSRISDVLNAPERDFLTLTEVSVEPLRGGPVELYPFLTVARRHIVFAVEALEPDG